MENQDGQQHLHVIEVEMENVLLLLIVTSLTMMAGILVFSLSALVGA